MQLTKTWLWKQRICRHALSNLILHRDNLTMRHQKGTEYSTSKLIRKGKPVTTNLNLQLNLAEHIKSAYQNRVFSTVTPEVNCKQPEQGLES